jgi:hypothetical protein
MMREVPAPEMAFAFNICAFFKIIDKGICPRICMYLFTRAYNWIPMSQFSQMHTSTTTHNIIIVMTAGFCVASNIDSNYCWVLRFVGGTSFEE